MVSEENPYIFFNRDELTQLLADEEVWENLAALKLPPDSNSQLHEQLLKEVAEACASATLLPVNQPGETAALAGKHNFVLHKFCWGTLKMGYALLGLIAKVKSSAVSPGGEDALGLAGSAKEVYNSVQKLDTDEWAIVEAIETLLFRTGYNILKAPGPTLEEIRRELEERGLEYDDLGAKLLDMRERTILNTEQIDGKTYYQIKYVRDWITGD